MIQDKLIILDNGHGIDTPGKRSPDGKFREYKWCREFVKLLKHYLEVYGYKVHLLVPEDSDVSLSERVGRVNTLCDKYGRSNCILVSVHNNAAGNGEKWYNASGWEAYTTPGKTNSDSLAELMYDEAFYEGLKIRFDKTDGDSDKEANFTVLKRSLCPAVLTENMFMDSRYDVEFLVSEKGIKSLLKIHLVAIRRYFEKYSTREEWYDANPLFNEFWKNLNLDGGTVVENNKCIYK